MKKRISKTCYVDAKNRKVKKALATWKVTATLDARGGLLQERWLKLKGQAGERLVVFLDQDNNLTPPKKAHWMVVTDYGSNGELLAERWCTVTR